METTTTETGFRISRNQLSAALIANKNEQLELGEWLRLAKSRVIKARLRARLVDLRIEAEALLDS